MNFGLEFVSQFFIDLYHKGYNLESFLKKSRYLFSNDYKNLRVHMYCLLGMPLMDSDYYAELANFAGQHRHIGFKLSYFLMDDAIMNNFGAFDGLEVLGNIKVNEFSSMGNMPAIDKASIDVYWQIKKEPDHDRPDEKQHPPRSHTSLHQFAFSLRRSRERRHLPCLTHHKSCRLTGSPT